MKCPNCGSENNDSAKFCKKCGTALCTKKIDVKSKNNTKLIIGVLIVIVIIIAVALIYFNGFNNNHSEENVVNVSNNNTENITQSDVTSPKTAEVESSSPMTIYGGSFETGSGLADKTYASVYVGSEHAGENVKIQILYSRDGNSLNNGNMVPKTVDSAGYINVRSADAYKYFPDYATINIYDTSDNLLCTQSVSLSPQSGTQTF